MVFGVEEFHAMGGIEKYYGGRRRMYVGASMHASTNNCVSLHISTDYFTRRGAFTTFRYVYSPNYAVPTLGVYREEDYLVEMSIPWNWWLVNRVRNNDRIDFYLNEIITPIYEVSITITTTIGVISITQELNYHNDHNKQSILPMSISLLV